jgi:hypothetical protein
VPNPATSTYGGTGTVPTDPMTGQPTGTLPTAGGTGTTAPAGGGLDSLSGALGALGGSGGMGGLMSGMQSTSFLDNLSKSQGGKGLYDIGSIFSGLWGFMTSGSGAGAGGMNPSALSGMTGGGSGMDLGALSSMLGGGAATGTNLVAPASWQITEQNFPGESYKLVSFVREGEAYVALYIPFVANKTDPITAFLTENADGFRARNAEAFHRLLSYRPILIDMVRPDAAALKKALEYLQNNYNVGLLLLLDTSK